MSLQPSRPAITVIGLALLLSGPVTVHGQGYRDLYKDALDAVKVQDWPTAIGLLRQAIKEQPTAKSGTFKKYVPHYYLGLSLYELGNCKSALINWEESQKQGVFKNLKEFSTLQHGVQVCEKRVIRKEALSDLAEVTGFATALQQLRNQPELEERWKQGDPSWDQRFTTADQLMKQARLVIERNDSQVALADLEKAREQVQSAARQLDIVQSEVQGEFKEIQAKKETRAEKEARMQLLVALQEEANQTLSDIADLEPFPPRLGELRNEVQLLLVDADEIGKSQHAYEIDGLRMALSGALERLKQASSPPPEALIAGANAFFSADYEQVLELLDARDLQSGRQAAHAQLFRAASLYSLWVASGEQEDQLRADASNAVQSCREEDITLVPLSKAFSPRFVEFFFSEGQVRAPIPMDQE